MRPLPLFARMPRFARLPRFEPSGTLAGASAGAGGDARGAAPSCCSGRRSASTWSDAPSPGWSASPASGSRSAGSGATPRSISRQSGSRSPMRTASGWPLEEVHLDARARQAAGRPSAYRRADRRDAGTVPRARYSLGRRGEALVRTAADTATAAADHDRPLRDRPRHSRRDGARGTDRGDSRRPGRIARRRGRNRAASAPYRRRARRVRAFGSAKRGRAGSAAAA